MKKQEKTEKMYEKKRTKKFVPFFPKTEDYYYLKPRTRKEQIPTNNFFYQNFLICWIFEEQDCVWMMRRHKKSDSLDEKRKVKIQWFSLFLFF